MHKIDFSHSLFHGHSPSRTSLLKTSLISLWSLELFFLWDYCLNSIMYVFKYELISDCTLNELQKTTLIITFSVSFRKRCHLSNGVIPWSTTNKRAHGKIVLAISSILQTPYIYVILVLSYPDLNYVIDGCFVSFCARMMSWHARPMYRESPRLNAKYVFFTNW